MAVIKVDENDPVGELEPTFPYRDVKIQYNSNIKDFYDLMEEIGRGKFGTVYRCREKKTGIELAAKFVAIGKKQDRRNVEREVEIMRTLQHPRLIQLYDAYEMKDVMTVVLEMIEGGELFERVIDDDFVLTEKSCTVFMRQICEGVAFIHANNIIHLDLKPENILCLTRTGNRIKIIDFGLARRYEPDKKLQVLFGTPEFVAPEVVNFEQITAATDMWSVGVICYVLLSGLSPFMGDNDLETMTNVTMASYDYEDEAFDTISNEAKDFISKLLVKDKTLRFTADECLDHEWLRKKPVPRLSLDLTKDNLRTFMETVHLSSPLIITREESGKIIEPDPSRLILQPNNAFLSKSFHQIPFQPQPFPSQPFQPQSQPLPTFPFRQHDPKHDPPIGQVPGNETDEIHVVDGSDESIVKVEGKKSNRLRRESLQSEPIIPLGLLSKRNSCDDCFTTINNIIVNIQQDNLDDYATILDDEDNEIISGSIKVNIPPASVSKLTLISHIALDSNNQGDSKVGNLNLNTSKEIASKSSSQKHELESNGPNPSKLHPSSESSDKNSSLSSIKDKEILTPTNSTDKTSSVIKGLTISDTSSEDLKVNIQPSHGQINTENSICVERTHNGSAIDQTSASIKITTDLPSHENAIAMVENVSSLSDTGSEIGNNVPSKQETNFCDEKCDLSQVGSRIFDLEKQKQSSNEISLLVENKFLKPAELKNDSVESMNNSKEIKKQIVEMNIISEKNLMASSNSENNKNQSSETISSIQKSQENVEKLNSSNNSFIKSLDINQMIPSKEIKENELDINKMIPHKSETGKNNHHKNSITSFHQNYSLKDTKEKINGKNNETASPEIILEIQENSQETAKSTNEELTSNKSLFQNQKQKDSTSKRNSNSESKAKIKSSNKMKNSSTDSKDIDTDAVPKRPTEASNVINDETIKIATGNERCNITEICEPQSKILNSTSSIVENKTAPNKISSDSVEKKQDESNLNECNDVGSTDDPLEQIKLNDNALPSQSISDIKIPKIQKNIKIPILTSDKSIGDEKHKNVTAQDAIDTNLKVCNQTLPDNNKIKTSKQNLPIVAKKSRVDNKSANAIKSGAEEECNSEKKKVCKKDPSHQGEPDNSKTPEPLNEVENTVEQKKDKLNIDFTSGSNETKAVSVEIIGGSHDVTITQNANHILKVKKDEKPKVHKEFGTAVKLKNNCNETSKIEHLDEPVIALSRPSNNKHSSEYPSKQIVEVVIKKRETKKEQVDKSEVSKKGQTQLCQLKSDKPLKKLKNDSDKLLGEDETKSLLIDVKNQSILENKTGKYEMPLNQIKISENLLTSIQQEQNSEIKMDSNTNIVLKNESKISKEQQSQEINETTLTSTTRQQDTTFSNKTEFNKSPQKIKNSYNQKSDQKMITGEIQKKSIEKASVSKKDDSQSRLELNSADKCKQITINANKESVTNLGLIQTNAFKTDIPNIKVIEEIQKSNSSILPKTQIKIHNDSNLSKNLKVTEINKATENSNPEKAEGISTDSKNVFLNQQDNKVLPIISNKIKKVPKDTQRKQESSQVKESNPEFNSSSNVQETESKINKDSKELHPSFDSETTSNLNKNKSKILSENSNNFKCVIKKLEITGLPSENENLPITSDNFQATPVIKTKEIPEILDKQHILENPLNNIKNDQQLDKIDRSSSENVSESGLRRVNEMEKEICKNFEVDSSSSIKESNEKKLKVSIQSNADSSKLLQPSLIKNLVLPASKTTSSEASIKKRQQKNEVYPENKIESADVLSKESLSISGGSNQNFEANILVINESKESKIVDCNIKPLEMKSKQLNTAKENKQSKPGSHLKSLDTENKELKKKIKKVDTLKDLKESSQKATTINSKETFLYNGKHVVGLLPNISSDRLKHNYACELDVSSNELIIQESFTLVPPFMPNTSVAELKLCEDTNCYHIASETMPTVKDYPKFSESNKSESNKQEKGGNQSVEDAQISQSNDEISKAKMEGKEESPPCETETQPVGMTEVGDSTLSFESNFHQYNKFELHDTRSIQNFSRTKNYSEPTSNSTLYKSFSNDLAHSMLPLPDRTRELKSSDYSSRATDLLKKIDEVHETFAKTMGKHYSLLSGSSEENNDFTNSRRFCKMARESDLLRSEKRQYYDHSSRESSVTAHHSRSYRSDSISSDRLSKESSTIGHHSRAYRSESTSKDSPSSYKSLYQAEKTTKTEKENKLTPIKLSEKSEGSRSIFNKADFEQKYAEFLDRNKDQKSLITRAGSEIRMTKTDNHKDSASKYSREESVSSHSTQPSDEVSLRRQKYRLTEKNKDVPLAPLGKYVSSQNQKSSSYSTSFTKIHSVMSPQGLVTFNKDGKAKLHPITNSSNKS